MSTAEGYVLPKPGVPKTLGLLNIIFGILLVLLGLIAIVMTLVVPVLLQGVETAVKQERARTETAEQAQKKAFDDRLVAAKTDEEKKAIEDEIKSLPPRPMANPVDFSMMTDVFNDPKIMLVNNAGILSGLILHIMLIVAGVGLIRLAPWGRSLSLWWSVLQIVQIIALLIGTIVYVLPATQANMDKQFAKIPANPDPKAAQVAQAGAQMSKLTRAIQVPMTVAQSMTGMVYPIVLLIMLNSAGARAACLARKSVSIDDL